jgi:hypothetical protein
MIRIKKKFPTQYLLICEDCGKEGYFHKKYFDKFGWKHKCSKKIEDEVAELMFSPMETSGRLEIPEPHKDEAATIEPIDIDEVVDSEETKAETEKIIKKHRKTKNK